MEEVREDVRVAVPIEALPSEVASEVSADETFAIRVLERHIERLECEAAEAKSEIERLQARAGQLAVRAAMIEILECQIAEAGAESDRLKAAGDRWRRLAEDHTAAVAQAAKPQRRWWRRAA